MDDAKEFEAKTLDEAVILACEYFDLPREKLEIDFIQDAKSGILGLGARKAIIHAKRADIARVRQNVEIPKSAIAETGVDALGRLGGHDKKSRGNVRAKNESRTRESAMGAQAGKAGAYQDVLPEKHTEKAKIRNQSMVRKKERDKQPDSAESVKHRDTQLRGRIEKTANFEPSVDNVPQDGFDEDIKEYGSRVQFSDSDVDKLRELVYEAAMRLITPITGPMRLDISIRPDRIDVRVDSENDLGLLIGREGQNLSSLQYLISRIVSRAMAMPVRIIITAGDYRERQDEKLRDLALSLAAQVKSEGRALLTKPLSSYQRRIIHLSLQDDPEIQTRSSGDGALKRVVVQRRKQATRPHG
jgi:spoIIIJ-associated protein